MLVLLLVSLISGILAVAGLPSAVVAVMFLLSLLQLTSLHAVAGFTVFASIPAFECVHTACDGAPVVASCCCLHPDCGRHSCCVGVLEVPVGFLMLVSLLLLPFLVFLWRSCCYWLSCCWRRSCCCYRTMAIDLSKYRILYCSAELKKLSDYRISDQGLNLSDYRISA